MAHYQVQSAVAELLNTVGKIADDLDQPTMDQVVRQLDRLSPPVSDDDALALLSLLPEGGDIALEVNWTVLHAVEACPAGPSGTH